MASKNPLVNIIEPKYANYRLQKIELKLKWTWIWFKDQGCIKWGCSSRWPSHKYRRNNTNSNFTAKTNPRPPSHSIETQAEISIPFFEVWPKVVIKNLWTKFEAAAHVLVARRSMRARSRLNNKELIGVISARMSSRSWSRPVIIQNYMYQARVSWTTPFPKKIWINLTNFGAIMNKFQFTISIS